MTDVISITPGALDWGFPNTGIEVRVPYALHVSFAGIVGRLMMPLKTARAAPNDLAIHRDGFGWGTGHWQPPQASNAAFVITSAPRAVIPTSGHTATFSRERAGTRNKHLSALSSHSTAVIEAFDQKGWGSGRSSRIRSAVRSPKSSQYATPDATQRTASLWLTVVTWLPLSRE